MDDTWRNLDWLWGGFSLAWGLHLLYVFSLARRQKSLREQVEHLKAQLEDRGEG